MLDVGESSDVMKPTVGQYFDTLDEGREFYYKYAATIGFSVRSSSSLAVPHPQTGERQLRMKRFLCSNEGFYKERSSVLSLSKSVPSHSKANTNKVRKFGIVRTGCKASIKFMLDQSVSKWYVSTFNEEHNHQLTTHPKLRYLGRNRKISMSNRSLLESLSSVNIPPSKQDALFESQSSGFVKMGCTELDLKNMKRDVHHLTLMYDVDLLIEKFEQKKLDNPQFFYSIVKDEDGHLRHAFWADPISILDYKLFGDVVTFDITYKSNLYCIIFGLLCGVNHHKNSIIFGSAFLSNETTETFIWLFKTFAECMSVPPSAIITDQNPAIDAALVEAYPDTFHRLSKLHIIHKMPNKIGHVFRNKEAMNVFHDVVDKSESSNDFESGWMKWIHENELSTNDWLKSIYDLRHKWAPSFLCEHFFAGIYATQHSKDMNGFLKSKVTSNNTLFEFVCRFDVVLKSIRENENLLDHIDELHPPKLITQLEIEKSLSNIYTSELFREFQEQLIQSVYFVVHSTCSQPDSSSIQTFGIIRLVTQNQTALISCQNGTTHPRCCCHSYEFSGIPCRHILAYFNHFGITELPPGLITNRWNRHPRASNDNDDDRSSEDIEGKKTFLDVERLSDELLHYARNGPDYCDIAAEHLNNALQQLEKMSNPPHSTKKHQSITRTEEPEKDCICVAVPNKVKTKGDESRFKGRQCKKCYKFNAGHDSRNCPNGGPC